MVDSTKIQINKLNNNNYQVWKYKLELLLIKEDLWSIVESAPPDPVTTAWSTKDAKARAHIGLLVEDNQLIHIKKEKSAKTMWEALRKYHEKSTLSNRVRLLRRLCKMTMSEGDDLENHLIAMEELMDELATLGDALTEPLTVAFYLSSLPESYSTLVTALESRPEMDLTSNLVKGKLLEEYARKKEMENSTRNGERALNINSKPILQKFNSKSVSCYFCKKAGHIKADCRKFLAWKRKRETGSTINKVEEEESKNQDAYVCLMVATPKQSGTMEWCVDSGASAHMCNDKNCFIKIDESQRSTVTLADGRKLQIKGNGTVRFKTATSQLQLEDVLLVPELQCNLLSVSKLARRGCNIVFENHECRISLNGKILLTVSSRNDVYKAPTNQVFSVKTSAGKCLHEWHKVLGHRNLSDIRKLSEVAVNVRIENCQHSDECETCLQSKSTRDSFPKESTLKTSERLDLVHTDLCGPMQLATPRGNRYILTLIDDFTRYSFIYLIRNKSDVTDKIIEFVELMKTQFGKVPKAFRSDRGGEYIDHQLQSFLRKRGIKVQLTVPQTPQQNGVAERKNRTLVEMTRCMLLGSGLQKKFWGEAVNTANHILNRLPGRSVIKTPYELWHNRKPDLVYFREFGAPVVAHIPKNQRRKLDNTGEKLVFVGYEFGTKGYRLLDVELNKIKISRDVKFIARNMIDEQVVSDFNNNISPVFEELDQQPEINVNLENRSSSSEVGQSSNETPQDEQVRRTNRTNFGIPPVRLIQEINKASVETVNKDPITYKAAINGPDAAKWKYAMDEEIESLRLHGTWILTTLPSGSKAIGSKWVYKTKTDQEGNVTKFKARLVAKGFTQKYGEDFDEVFAPVANPITLKILLTVAGKNKMIVNHFDIQTAYLNGNLSHDVYMRQPEGYVQGNQNEVCKLVKNLYGLKQGANEWNRCFDGAMKRNGYVQSNNDACLYIKYDCENVIYISNHVDDIVGASTKQEMLDDFEKDINAVFAIKNLGSLKFYLGIHFNRDEEGIFYMHQQNYIENKLHEFSLMNAKGSSTPMNTGYNNQDISSVFFNSQEVYRSAIGSLLYLSTNTRPDIAIATSILARRVSEPRKCDWVEVKRVFRYLSATKDLKLKLGDGKSNNDLKCYVDSDWAGDNNDRKSTSGYCFIFEGALIAWCSKKQTLVSLSTTEAEFIAFAEAARELIWIDRVLQDLGQSIQRPIQIFEDNQGCIKLLQNIGGHQRTKHIDIKYKFARDLVASKFLDVIYCTTENMIADLLTKPLNGQRLAKLVNEVGLVNRFVER